MIYRDFRGIKLSALGFGSMRLPVRGEYSDIDEEQTAEMVDYAIGHGVNYFDTAWGYHDGESENVMGKILSRYPRDSWYLATKFPGYDLANMGKTEQIFEAQLKKCRVDHFDFYLFHNVCEMNIDAYLDDEKYGTYTYLKKQKVNGRIKHLGFSAHGDLDVMRRFLEKYGKDMEFCQLQINWFDWKFQKAKEKVDMLREYGIPVWVMEPLRGGRLVNLGEEDEAKLRAVRPDESIPAWSFRFLQTIPDVKVTLSGMSDLEQIKANIATFEQDRPLDEKELAVLGGIADEMIAQSALPCTACRYCTSHCPRHLDIPQLIKLYNEHRFTGGGFIAPMVLGTMPKDKWPSACVGCRSCERVCPQGIKISEMMKDFSKRIEA